MLLVHMLFFTCKKNAIHNMVKIQLQVTWTWSWYCGRTRGRVRGTDRKRRDGRSIKFAVETLRQCKLLDFVVVVAVELEVEAEPHVDHHQRKHVDLRIAHVGIHRASRATPCFALRPLRSRISRVTVIPYGDKLQLSNYWLVVGRPSRAHHVTGLVTVAWVPSTQAFRG